MITMMMMMMMMMMMIIIIIIIIIIISLNHNQRNIFNFLLFHAQTEVNQEGSDRI